MSKADELRILRGARSIDAPKQYHHRTGDSEGDGGSMLDSYVQVEESYFDDEEEAAKAAFLKGFQGYLEKVFEGNERKFLRRLMKGQGKPHEIGRALGVDWFECLQSIQRKAFENVEPLERLALLTGWSRAEEFTAGILRKVSKYTEGATGYAQANRNKLRESLKAEGAEHQAEQENKVLACKNAYAARTREETNAKLRAKRAANREEYNKKQREYRARTREHVRARDRAYYYEKNREKRLAREKKKREEHGEEVRAYRTAYREAHREKIKAQQAAHRAANREEIKAYRAAHREEINAKQRAYRAAHREEIAAKQRAYRAAHREEIDAKQRAYRAAHREEIAARNRAYKEAHREEINAKRRAKRAAEKAAKLAALAATALTAAESCPAACKGV